jgi:hypothetical protein
MASADKQESNVEKEGKSRAQLAAADSLIYLSLAVLVWGTWLLTPTEN